MRILLVLLLLIPTTLFAQRNFMVDYRADFGVENQKFTFNSFGNSEKSSAEIPGFARVLSSAVIPGSGQLMQKKWAKGATFLMIEALAVFLAIDKRREAQRLERLYHELGDSNFSVALYADWIVRYNQHFGFDVDLQDVAAAGVVIDLNNLSANMRDHWNLVDIEKLRALEMSTLFGGNSGNAFSHVMPDYGSQQYYELMSKYFQFGPGWTDFNLAPGPVVWGKVSMSPLWFQHGGYNRDFNDAYRFSANMVNVIVLNHFVSFFDALIGSRKQNISFSADMTVMNTPALRAKIAFR